MKTEVKPPDQLPKSRPARFKLVRRAGLVGLGLLLAVVGLVVFRSFNQTNYNLTEPEKIAPGATVAGKTLAGTAHTPAEMLAQGAVFMDGIQSLHLNWQIRQGKLNVGQAEIKAASADLLQPDRFKAQVKVQILFASFELPVIGVGNEQFQRDELGNWHRSKPEETINLSGLIDKQIGVGSTMLKLQNPQYIGLETIDGLPVYHLQGVAGAASVAGLTANRLGQREATIEVWLDQSHTGQVDQFSIKELGGSGPTPAANSLAWWVFRFTAFNQPITIDKPKAS